MVKGTCQMKLSDICNRKVPVFVPDEAEKAKGERGLDFMMGGLHTRGSLYDCLTPHPPKLQQ